MAITCTLGRADPPTWACARESMLPHSCSPPSREEEYLTQTLNLTPKYSFYSPVYLPGTCRARPRLILPASAAPLGRHHFHLDLRESSRASLRGSFDGWEEKNRF